MNNHKLKIIASIALFLLCIAAGEFMTSDYMDKKLDDKVSDWTGIKHVQQQPATYINQDDFNTTMKATPSYSTDDPHSPDSNDGTVIQQDAKSFIWNFLGVVKSGQYDTAAHFFEPNIMTSYFYENYNSYEDYSGKLKEFGNGLSRSETLASFDLQKLSKLQDNQEKAELRLIYRDRREAHVQLLLQYNEEITGYVILTPVKELLNQVKP